MTNWNLKKKREYLFLFLKKSDKRYKKRGKVEQNFENSLIMHQFCIKHNEKNQNE